MEAITVTAHFDNDGKEIPKTVFQKALDEYLKQDNKFEIVHTSIGDTNFGESKNHTVHNPFQIRQHKMKEIDWESIRIQMAENFMANMLNSDETFRTKIVSDVLYKEIAKFSVKCADALIEELKK